MKTIQARKKYKVMTKHPAWHKLDTGRAIGFLKLQSGEYWHARMAYKGSHLQTRLGPVTTQARDGKLSYRQAVDLAFKWYAEQEAHAGIWTVQQAFDAYIKHLSLNNGTEAARQTQRRLENHVPQHIKRQQLEALSVEALYDWLSSLVTVMELDVDPESTRQAKASANRILSMVKAAFNHSYNLGKVHRNEWRKVKPLRGAERGKANLLSQQQVASLLQQAEGAFKDLLLASIYTGARYKELRSATVSDFHADSCSLLLKTKKGGSGDYRERVSVLSASGCDFFKQLAKDRHPSDFLLVKDNGQPWQASEQTRPFKRAVKASQDSAVPVPEWATLYSLRHYHISQAVNAGLPLTDVAVNCGTSVQMLEKTYAKSSSAYKRQMMNSVDLGV
jgi:integrase